jgi:hypothetical protein
VKWIFAFICACCLSLQAAPATAFFPVRDVRPGMKGVGRTIFNGDRIEEFQVDILGVLNNLAPNQAIVLARLSGGPLANVGVLQGMSGSPVYIDGKLLGAVALGFPFSKEPIAGIQPIDQMTGSTDVSSAASASAPRVSYGEWATQWQKRLEPDLAQLAQPAQPELHSIATPVAFSGFTESTLNVFSGALRKFGFEPLAGTGAGAPTTSQYSGTVQPGSMISVQLMKGDLNVSADGTVTYVDGKRVYAFGHRFLAAGSTDLPFSRAEVITLLPSLNSSFKISSARELVGSITSDVSTAIAGEIGRPARMIPLHLDVRGRGGSHRYNIDVARDRLLTPFLAQMALFSAIDSTQRSSGAGSIRVKGKVEFQGGQPPLVLDNSFAADTAVAVQSTLNLVVPISFLLQSGFSDLTVKDITFTLDVTEQKRQLDIQDVWLSSGEARPGDTVNLTCMLSGEGGVQQKATAAFKIPVGIPAGKLFFTVSEGNLLNFGEVAGLSPLAVRSSRQMIGILNGIRPNDKAYVRVWRQEPSFSLPGSDLTDPPPSVSIVLSRSSGTSGGGSLASARGAQLAEIPVAVGDYAVTGSKTVQLEVKE